MDNNIDFNSQDIKNKDVEFNVKEKKSDKLKKTWKKDVLESAPLKGNNKFITLGVSLFVIAAAVTLPIVLPELLKSTTEQTPEEVEEEKIEAMTELTTTINSINNETTDDAKEAILADLDDKIENASEERIKSSLFVAKSMALSNFGDHNEAISIAEPAIEWYRDNKEWSQLANTYNLLCDLYNKAGDLPSAVSHCQAILQAFDDATANGTPITEYNRSYFELKLKRLEESQ